MGDPIWAEARRRARAEALDTVKLNSASRILLTIGTPLVAFGATLGLTGQLAVAALATVAWTLFCGLLIFVAKLIRAPAKIAAEKQQELEAELAKRETAEQRQTKRMVLAQTIEGARRLKGVCETRDVELPHGAIDQWYAMVKELMVELGPEYSARFESNAGLLPIGPGGGLTEEQSNYWTWLNYREQRLLQFLNELR